MIFRAARSVRQMSFFFFSKIRVSRLIIDRTKSRGVDVETSFGLLSAFVKTVDILD